MASTCQKGHVSAALTWGDVDRAAGVVTLRAEHSKNGEPRTLPLTGELAALIDRRWAARVITRGETTTVCPSVFHQAGRRIGDFRKAWASACIAAGFSRPKLDGKGVPVVDRAGRPVPEPTLIFHDLRRSAVRNLDRAGVSQSVAMSITGHKTVSVYHRYRIVRVDDQRRALKQTQAATATMTERTVVPLTRREAMEA